VGDHSAIRCRRGLASVCEIEPDRRWRRSNPRWMCPRLTQTDGEVFCEVLVALSDAERFYSYTFVSSPVPVRNHETTLRVLPITDGNRSYVEWSSRFEIDPEYETQLVDLMNRNFLAGLRNLAKKSSRDGPASS
jgi:Polyketide cyclase / dehydrase and lipid transport